MKIHDYWRKFIEHKGYDEDLGYQPRCFCDNEKDAKELAELVVVGKKQATSSNGLCYEFEKEPLPKEGDFSIITDFYNRPLCIIKTIKVDIIQFKDITAEMAVLEGEGDLSLDYWREGHKYFFSKECKEMGKEFNEELPVVFEQFKVVFI